MGSLKLSVAPAAEPVLLAEAKDHMRVDLSDDDTLITALLIAAKDKVEELTGRKFINQTWIWTFDDFPESDILRIPLAPIFSFTKIETTDEDDVTTEFAASNYIADILSEPARIVLKSGVTWPPVQGLLKEVNGVTATFVVGYGTAGSDVPESLKLAIKELTGHYYENRELVAPLDLKQIPMSVLALVESFRAWNRFGSVDKNNG